MADKTNVVVKIQYNDFAIPGVDLGAKTNVTRSAEVIRSEAAVKVPRKFGQLANSLMWTGPDGEKDGFNKAGGSETAPSEQELTIKPKAKEIAAYVGTNSDHWYPEFGTRYQAAQPFLRPAVAEATGSTETQIQAQFGKLAMAEEFIKRKKRFEELKG